MLRTVTSDLDVKAHKLDELRKEEQQIKKLLTNHQKMIFACILEGALWAMSTVLEKVRKQEEVREMYKGDIAQ